MIKNIIFISSYIVLFAAITSCKENPSQAAAAAEQKDTLTAQTAPQDSVIRNPNDSLASTLAKTSIEFKETRINKGKLKQGTVVNLKYEFKNTGDAPLKIINARGSCGCTVATWPQTEIAPGESSFLEAQFNTKGLSGKQNKKITVTANTDPINTIVEFDAEVTQDPREVTNADTPSLELKPQSR